MLTYIADIVDGVTDVSAALLNSLRDRAMNVFADDTARAAEVASPDAGRPFYYRSSDAAEGLYIANTAGNVDPVWNGSWGVLGTPAEVTANQGSIAGTETDLTGLSVTFDTPGNRFVLVMFQLYAASTGSDTTVVRIKEGATQLQPTYETLATNAKSVPGSVLLTPGAGSHTYKLTMQRAAGTGTETMYASATSPAQLTVFDMGPAGAPT